MTPKLFLTFLATSILILVLVLLFDYQIESVNLGIFTLIKKEADVEEVIDSSNVAVQFSHNPSSIAVRPLEPLETGKKISTLPNGVYFFASPIEIEYEIEESGSDFLEASSRKRINYSFEIQKVDQRYYLVGFVSDESYSQMGMVNSQNSLYTILYPNAWAGAMHAVAIPFDAIYAIHERTIELDEMNNMRVFDIGFKEALNDPETH